MDQLINCLERFKLDEVVNFENELDAVIERMTDIRVYESSLICLSDDEDPDIEWEILSQNYSKLRYLIDLITVFPLKTSKFYCSLNTFFETIDTVNQRYLKIICWYSIDQMINIRCMETKWSLEQSLNTSDITLKMKYILNAYEHLVYIGEYYRKEKVNNIVDDEEFLENFGEY